MSSLAHLPAVQTFEYWHGRLNGHPFRSRFLATKIIEIFTYQMSRSKTSGARQPAIGDLLGARPAVIRNGVGQQSRPAIVIPVRCKSLNECELLERLLATLRWQEADVTLVNDGSSHWPRLSSEHNVLTFASSKGPAAARNAGIQAALSATANPILMTDFDCVPCARWVQEAVAGFRENPYIHAISGKTVSRGSTWFDTYHDINGTLNGRRFKQSKALLYGPTCNFAISHVVATEITFDESFKNAACEDIDFCYRLLGAGYRLVHRESMLVRHDYQFRAGSFFGNVSRFIRQFRKYASAEADLLRNHPDYHFHFGQTEEIANR